MKNAIFQPTGYQQLKMLQYSFLPPNRIDFVDQPPCPLAIDRGQAADKCAKWTFFQCEHLIDNVNRYQVNKRGDILFIRLRNVDPGEHMNKWKWSELD